MVLVALVLERSTRYVKNVLFIFLITLLFVQCFYYDVCTLILREKKINIFYKFKYLLFFSAAE